MSVTKLISLFTAFAMLMSGCLFAQQQLLPSNILTIPSPTPSPAASPAPVDTSAPGMSTLGSSTPSSGPTGPVPPPNAAQQFAGQGPNNTHPFTMKDKWEVDWFSPGPLTITLCRFDGKPDEVVAQQTGPSHGSSFEPTGAQCFFKIAGTGNWSVWTVQLGDTVAAAPPAPAIDTALTPTVAPSATTPTFSASSNFQGTIVIVKGAEATGTGFLIKRPEGTCLITNQHVIWSNPNLSFQTVDGKQLTVTKLLGATDRDLALFLVKDDGTLPVLATDPNVGDTVLPQDDTIIPGNSQGAMVVTNTPGKVVAVGPMRLEVSNPVYPGNSGGPVMDLRLNQAVSVITEVEKSETDGFVNQSSLANPNSSVAAVRYFSLRFDNVPRWEPMDLNIFNTQTQFIDKFHDQTMDMISFARYLRNRGRSANNQQPVNDNDGISDSLFTRNPKLMELKTDIFDSTANADDPNAVNQELIMALTGISQDGVDKMTNPNNFYQFNQLRAKDEVDARTEITNALKQLSDQQMRKSL